MRHTAWRTGLGALMMVMAAAAAVAQQAPDAANPAPADQYSMNLGQLDRKPALLNYRQVMRDIVDTLVFYARRRDPEFAILARGGYGLLTRTKREYTVMDDIATEEQRVLDKDIKVGETMSSYIADLDGVVADALFCGNPLPGEERTADSLTLLMRFRQDWQRLLSLDYCAGAGTVQRVYQRATRSGFLPYVATEGPRLNALPNYPPRPWQANAAGVETLVEAKNYVALFDTRQFGSRQELVASLALTNYDALLLEPFHGGDEPLSFNQIKQLKVKRLGTRRLVLARLQLATAREGAYYWKKEWVKDPPQWLGAPIEGRAGEYLVDYWDPEWKEIIGYTFKGLMDLGYDGVILDDLGAYRPFEARLLDAGPSAAPAENMEIHPFTIP